MVFGGGEAGDVLRVRAADMGVSGWWRLWRGVYECVDVSGGKRLACPPHHRLSAAPAACFSPLSLFFTRGNFLLLNAASGDEGVGLGGWLIPQVGADFALGVRPVLRHQADRFPLRFSSILKCGVRCVKEAILSCKCVFFCVW